MIHGVGKVCADFYLNVPEYPRENGLTYIGEHSFHMGGMAANALYAASRFREETRLYSYAGRDYNGELLLRKMGELSLRTDCLSLGRVTDFSNIIISGVNRTILHYKGDFDRRASDFSPDFSPGDVLLIDCTILEDLEGLLIRAKKEGVVTVMDISPSLLSERVNGILPYVDFLIPSFEWAGKFTGREKAGDMGAALLAKGAGNVIITNGKHAIYYFDEKGERGYYIPPDFPVKNSNGAGDTFHGAFCYGMSRRWDAQRAILFAMTAASYKCQYGTIDLIPGEEEIIQNIKEIQKYDF